MKLLYISFADDNGWRGCVLVESDSTLPEITRECWRRGCNPGGSVMSLEVPPDAVMSPEEAAWFATKPRWTLITEPPPGAMKIGEVEDDAPYVCPGCHAVAGRCAPGCIDAEIEEEREHDFNNPSRQDEDDDEAER